MQIANKTGHNLPILLYYIILIIEYNLFYLNSNPFFISLQYKKSTIRITRVCKQKNIYPIGYRNYLIFLHFTAGRRAHNIGLTRNAFMAHFLPRLKREVAKSVT